MHAYTHVLKDYLARVFLGPSLSLSKTIIGRTTIQESIACTVKVYIIKLTYPI